MRVSQRGRAIVRRLPSPLDNRTFRPGDFVLTRSEGALARMLGWATGGELNHAAMIVDVTGGLIEVTPHMTPGMSALRRSHIADYLDAGQPCWVGYVELQEGTRQAVIEFAQTLHASQTPMNEIGIVALVLHAFLCIAPRARAARHVWLRPLHPLFDRHALVLREEHTYLSGEFVARALERGGFLWDVDPAHVTPADLFARFHLADEPARGVLVPFMRARRSRPSQRAALPRQTPARVSPLMPRVLHTTQSASATAIKAEAMPQDVAAMSSGVRAVLQVALLTLGSLSVVHGIERLVESIRQG